MTDNQEQAGWRAYLDMRYRSVLMEIGELRRLLGYNRHRCPHCGCELK